MKRLITGFAVGALAVTLFVPQVSSNLAFAAETGASVVVIDGKVNGTPVGDYVVKEFANGRELSEVIAELVNGGKNLLNVLDINGNAFYLSEIVKGLIAAGISPATAAGVVTKAAPEYAAPIAAAATSGARDIEEVKDIVQAAMNEAPAQAQAIKDSVLAVISQFGTRSNQGMFDDIVPASKS